MTTQAVEVTLIASDGSSVLYSATVTDDTWTALDDEVSALQPGKRQKGKSIVAYQGEYAAGGAFVRVMDSQNNRIRMLEPLDLITCQKIHPIRPFTVGEDDIIAVFATVAGS